MLFVKITPVLWQRVSPILLFVKITEIFWQHVSPKVLFVKITLVFLAACLTDPALRQNHRGHLAARVMIRSLNLKSSGTKVDKRGRLQDGRSALTLHSSASRQGREQGECKDDKLELPEGP